MHVTHTTFKTHTDTCFAYKDPVLPGSLNSMRHIILSVDEVISGKYIRVVPLDGAYYIPAQDIVIALCNKTEWEPATEWTRIPPAQRQFLYIYSRQHDFGERGSKRTKVLDIHGCLLLMMMLGGEAVEQNRVAFATFLVKWFKEHRVVADPRLSVTLTEDVKTSQLQNSKMSPPERQNNDQKQPVIQEDVEHCASVKHKLSQLDLQHKGALLYRTLCADESLDYYGKTMLKENVLKILLPSDSHREPLDSFVKRWHTKNRLILPQDTNTDIGSTTTPQRNQNSEQDYQKTKQYTAMDLQDNNWFAQPDAHTDTFAYGKQETKMCPSYATMDGNTPCIVPVLPKEKAIHAFSEPDTAMPGGDTCIFNRQSIPPTDMYTDVNQGMYACSRDGILETPGTPTNTNYMSPNQNLVDSTAYHIKNQLYVPPAARKLQSTWQSTPNDNTHADIHTHYITLNDMASQMKISLTKAGHQKALKMAIEAYKARYGHAAKPHERNGKQVFSDKDHDLLQGVINEVYDKSPPLHNRK